MSKTKKHNTDKIEKIITSEIVGDLEDIVIFQNTDGSYELFNTYMIEKKSEKEYYVSFWKQNYFFRITK